VQCVDDTTCSGGTPYCDTSLDRCVACLTDANCGDAGLSCVNGACSCGTNKRVCNGSCIDVSADNNNCGTCGHTCDTTMEQCVAGQCQCLGSLESCFGTCVDTTTEPRNCGQCGRQCRRDQVCADSTCVCRPGLTDCNGFCVDLNSNPFTCG